MNNLLYKFIKLTIYCTELIYAEYTFTVMHKKKHNEKLVKNKNKNKKTTKECP